MSGLDFNNDFLQRQANPNELGAIVQMQGTRIAQVAQSFMRVNNLDEVAAAIGELQFIARDPSGQARMIMSAVNLLGEYGIDAHLAGFDVNGVPQFYLSADDGSIVAAGGLLKIDRNGITDASSLLGLTSKDASNQNIVGKVWYSFNSGDQPVVQGLHVFHFVSDTARFSDNFEDGTLSAWATSGSPSIETDGVQEGSYYARLSSVNTISKTLSASAYGANTWYFVTCIYRSTAVGGSLQLEYGGASPVIHGLSTMQADTWYRAFIVFQANADTTPTLTFSKNGAGTLDIDDVYVNEMNVVPFGIGGVSGFGTVTSDLEVYGDVNLKSGMTVNINGVALATSGTWTPTGTTGTNVAAMTPHISNYIRVGNQVFFNGSVNIDTTAVGAFTCYLTIPIASDFNSNFDANGNGTQPGAGVPNIFSIREDQTNDRLQLDGYAQSTVDTFYRFTGGYVVK